MQSEFTLHSSSKNEVFDVTPQVAAIVARAGADDGICSIYVTHATAAIVINENDDPNIGQDLLDALDQMVPEGVWRHDRVDGNGAAHLKAAILGPGETVPICAGKLQLGTWQAIMLVDLDERTSDTHLTRERVTPTSELASRSFLEASMIDTARRRRDMRAGRRAKLE